MSHKVAKKLRKIGRLQADQFMLKTKDYINGLPILGRIKIAWRIICKDF